MLCSHSFRAGPCSRYAERGCALMDRRSPLVPAFLRNRNVQGESSEIPTTSPNTERSVPADRCARTVLDQECLLERRALQPERRCCRVAQRYEEPGKLFGLLQAGAVEVVAPAERDDPALALETVELKRRELESLQLLITERSVPASIKGWYRNPSGKSDRPGSDP